MALAMAVTGFQAQLRHVQHEPTGRGATMWNFEVTVNSGNKLDVAAWVTVKTLYIYIYIIIII